MFALCKPSLNCYLLMFVAVVLIVMEFSPLLSSLEDYEFMVIVFC